MRDICVVSTKRYCYEKNEQQNILYTHNLSVYPAFCKEIELHHKALLVAATGIGKSYISLQYLIDNDLSALIISPTNSSIGQWQDAISENNLDLPVTFSTYQGLKKLSSLKNYDAIIVDEAHHCAAPIWKSEVRRLWEASGCILIGLTATQTRYSDGIDTANTFWNGRIVEGYSLSDAVREGILPTFEYVVGLLEITDLLKERKAILEGKNGISKAFLYKERALKAIQSIELNEENEFNAQKIIYKHMPKGKRKGIVFTNNIKSFSDAEKFVKETLGVPVFKVHSQLSKTANQKSLDAFKNASEGYIITVDMLGEGVHIGGVNTLIMFRRTLSSSIFTQQLGRALSASNKNNEDIIIFDLVANIQNVDYKLKLDNDLVNITVVPNKEDILSIREKENKKPRTKKQIVVFDYALSIIETLKKIDVMLSSTWTDEDNKYLRDNYHTLGCKKCAARLGRGIAACQKQAQKLDIAKAAAAAWSDEELQYICEHYQADGIKKCANHLGRTPQAISAKAYQMGIAKKGKKAIYGQKKKENYRTCRKTPYLSAGI